MSLDRRPTRVLGEWIRDGFVAGEMVKGGVACSHLPTSVVSLNEVVMSRPDLSYGFFLDGVHPDTRRLSVSSASR